MIKTSPLPIFSASGSGNDMLDMEEVREKFKSCDEDQDGKISSDECTNQWTGDGFNLGKVDKDKDKKISWEELEVAAAVVVAKEKEGNSLYWRVDFVSL